MKKLLKIVGVLLNALSVVNPKWGGRLGIFLFCYPYQRNLKSKHKAFLERALEKNIDFQGNSIAQYKWGSGPISILMVHGYQSHSYRWKRFIESIDLSKYTVYAIDSPAHGLSTGKQFNVPINGQFLKYILTKELSIDILIGHSVGAFTLLYTLSEMEQSKVKQLILLASPGDAMDFMVPYRNYAGFNEQVEEAMQALLRERYGVDLHFFKAAKFAAKIKIPGLIIHDEEDQDCPVEYAHKIHSNWQESELFLTKGKGHRLTDDETIAKVVSFIGTVDAGTTV